jgi:hypothetical protein
MDSLFSITEQGLYMLQDMFDAFNGLIHLNQYTVLP